MFTCDVAEEINCSWQGIMESGDYKIKDMGHFGDEILQLPNETLLAWFSHGMTKGIKLGSHSWTEGLLRSTTLSSWGCCFLNCPFGMGEGVGGSRVWSVNMQKNCTCDSPPKNRIPTLYWNNLDRSSDAHEWVTPYDKPLILNMQTSWYKKSFVLDSFIRLSVWRTKSHKL